MPKLEDVSFKEQTYACPVCGYAELDVKPFKNLPGVMEKIYPAEVYEATPPYYLLWGEASYDVCPCCQVEFGFDDDPGGDDPGHSFAESLLIFVRDHNARWADPSMRPKDWSLQEQLTRAGISIDPKTQWLIEVKKL